MTRKLEEALNELDRILEEVIRLKKEGGIDEMDEFENVKDEQARIGSIGDGNSKFCVKTPLGKIEVDMEEFETAKTRAREIVNPPQFSKGREMTREFIGGEDKTDFR